MIQQCRQSLDTHPNPHVHIHTNHHQSQDREHFLVPRRLSQFPTWITTVLMSITMDEFCLFLNCNKWTDVKCLLYTLTSFSLCYVSKMNSNSVHQ